MNGKSNVLYVIITVLCCMVAAGTALLVEAAQDENTFVRKIELSTLCERISRLEAENREDHKGITITLQEILHEMGRLTGRVEAQEAP